jgi:hypothetical protein
MNELTVLDDDDTTGISSQSSHLEGLAALCLPGFLDAVHGLLVAARYWKRSNLHDGGPPFALGQRSCQPTASGVAWLSVEKLTDDE